MKKISIFIDHTGDDADQAFVSRIKDRLKSIKGVFSISSYTDISDDEAVNWEGLTIGAVKNADIVIPILSSSYLGYISDAIGMAFDQIIDSDNKYFFPILLNPSEWGGFNWIVRSKLIPENAQPLSELSANDQDRILNRLRTNIKDIILAHNAKQANDIDKPATTPSVGTNMVFISHDHDDADFAELLKMKLEKQGISSWIDSERLKIGQDWREEIDKGIENAIALIAVMTPDARKSEYVTYEWAFAWGKGKKFSQ